MFPFFHVQPREQGNVKVLAAPISFESLTLAALPLTGCDPTSRILRLKKHTSRFLDYAHPDRPFQCCHESKFIAKFLAGQCGQNALFRIIEGGLGKSGKHDVARETDQIIEEGRRLEKLTQVHHARFAG